MKIAVESQLALFMISLTRYVVYAWPDETLLGGCSLTIPLGITHDTAGRLPARAAPTRFSTDCTLPTWPFCCTSVKRGSGFQMLPVSAFWSTAGHTTTLPSQHSGSVPSNT